jgi:hypothetical protein
MRAVVAVLGGPSSGPPGRLAGERLVPLLSSYQVLVLQGSGRGFSPGLLGTPGRGAALTNAPLAPLPRAPLVAPHPAVLDARCCRGAGGVHRAGRLGGSLVNDWFRCSAATKCWFYRAVAGGGLGLVWYGYGWVAVVGRSSLGQPGMPLARTGPHTRTHAMPYRHIMPPLAPTHTMCVHAHTRTRTARRISRTHARTHKRTNARTHAQTPRRMTHVCACGSQPQPHSAYRPPFCSWHPQRLHQILLPRSPTCPDPDHRPLGY